MRFIISILIILHTVLFLIQCDNQNDIEAQRLSWLTEDPLSIPYRTRLQRYERDNLLRNGSFETGRTFSIDSNRTSFVVDGWQQIGQNIEWVSLDQDSIYDSDEVFSGNRAIKINRKRAYETDLQGEGIISDFIRVIPGNYDFSFYTRLKDIMPNRSRLGTRLYDAIEVQLLYYDRNKILLNSRKYFPQLDQYIDNSNKSLSFANYLNIPSLDWGRIIGKSYPFPFPDGDIPSNAYYIKVYLGLKGTGTMWIDSVSLQYSIKNFSVPERMNVYASDTSFFMHQIIIPTPKVVRNMESVAYYRSGQEEEVLPVIVIPQNATRLTLKAAEMLRKRIFEVIQKTSDNSLLREDILITTGISTEQLNESKLVISLGNTSLLRRYQEIMPIKDIALHNQGYLIYTSNDISNLVFLYGNNETGNYYAAVTAMQLFDRKQPIFHNARIIDYPDFENRLYMITGWNSDRSASAAVMASEELAGYKFNGAVLEITPDNVALSERSDQILFSYFNNSNNAVRNYGMVSLGEIYPDSLFNDSVHGMDINKTGFIWISDKVDEILSAGMDGIILAPFFQLPQDTTLCYYYPWMFPADYTQLEGFVNNMQAYIAARFPGRTFQYCPPYFNNELLDLCSTCIHPNQDIQSIPMLWTGNSFFGTQTDHADVKRFAAMTGGKSPVFFDNSMTRSSAWGQYNGAHPYASEKLKLYNLFEPFGNNALKSIFPYLDHSHFYINYPADSEINIIRLATAADFMWNINDYKPDYSLWKVLVMRYGIEAAQELVVYSGKYAEMLDILLKLNNNEQPSRNIKNGQDVLEELDTLLVNTEEILGSEHKLLLELLNANSDLKKQYDLYQITSAVE